LTVTKESGSLSGMTETARDYRLSARAQGAQRTRERILRVARDRFVERPYDEVTLADVAGGAGVTQQTLLNHFSSKEGLLLALGEVLGPEIRALRGTPAPGDVRGTVRALVRQYEQLGDANVRLQAVAERIPALAAGLDAARREHLAWLEQVFGDQIPEEPRERRRALAGLYAATDVGSWKLLRRDLGLSRADTTAVLEHLVRAAAAPTP
jgi:AcrR family transcriptional regulator